MKLKILGYHLNMPQMQICLSSADQEALGIRINDRASVETGRTAVVAFAMNSIDSIQPGYIVTSVGLLDRLGVGQGDEVEVRIAPFPKCRSYIRDKMDGRVLPPEHISTVVDDIYWGRLSYVEISAWLTALYINDMSIDEISAYCKAMVDTGKRIGFDRGPVFDFHSMGGIPGNKITPIVVSICAAAGLMIPKQSSRAISSACGTADFVEVFAPVALSPERVKQIGESVGGCFVWSGPMAVAPVDDALINVEHQLGINPRSQMLASIMAKKVGTGVEYLLIDIPMGEGTKVPTEAVAREYFDDFVELGRKLGIHVECRISHSDQPIGHAVGPALEAKECIEVLEGKIVSGSVVEKACDCAGIILGMGGIKDGAARAREILASGEALRKFREIVEAQGGDPGVRSGDIPVGKHTFDIVQDREGQVSGISNKNVVLIAKALGQPVDKGAGIYLFKKQGARVAKGETLCTLYADHRSKLDYAVRLAGERPPVAVGDTPVR